MSILEEKQVWRRAEAERKHLPNTLSQGQRAFVQRALAVLRMRYGRSGLAARMGLTYESMRKTLKRPPTMRVAVLVAFVAGVDVAEVISGAWPSLCPTCGGSGRCG